jgi:hypothetical protein
VLVVKPANSWIPGKSTGRELLSAYRKVVQAIITNFVEVDNGAVFSTTVADNLLKMSFYLPVSPNAACFSATKIKEYLHPSRADKKNCFGVLKHAVVHFGDILWRGGVSSGVVPYGPVVDEVNNLLNKLRKDQPKHTLLFCSTKTKSAEDQSKSRLIKYRKIPGFVDWMEPSDVLTRAIHTVFLKSKMAGRSRPRRLLSYKLERLLLVSETSITCLEARAGFGKTLTAGEIMSVAQELQLPSHVVRTSETDEGTFGIWIQLCDHLLKTIPKKDIGSGTGELVYHLPGNCGTTELSWLNDLLPPEWRVKDEELDAHDPDAATQSEERRAPNSNLKMNLFAQLLRSLIEMVSPFVFQIEDLQWMDSSSWKLLVIASRWEHVGIMFVCTTRPVPRSAAFDYAELCKGKHVKREALGPLDAADLTKLAEKHIPKERLTHKYLEKLKKTSGGFPFLAVELLMEDLSDPENSTLKNIGNSGASDDEAQQLQLHDRPIEPSKSEYTTEELGVLNTFYEHFGKSEDASWNKTMIEDGIEYVRERQRTGRAGWGVLGRRSEPVARAKKKGAGWKGRAGSARLNSCPRILTRFIRALAGTSTGLTTTQPSNKGGRREPSRPAPRTTSWGPS